MKKIFKAEISFFIALIVIGVTACKHSTKEDAKDYEIDRKSVVSQQNVVVSDFDTLSSLTVGNGDFAFTVDASGLQSFPQYYQGGVKLGTQSQWGWHSFPNPNHYSLDDILKEYDYYDRKIPYAYASHDTPRQKAASNWLRANPHRIDLGKIGFDIILSDGTEAKRSDYKNIKQKLNLWTGVIHSHFEIEGKPVDVQTVAHQDKDQISVRIQSPLIEEGRLRAKFRFGYPAGQWKKTMNWKSPEKHQTDISRVGNNQTVITHTLDSTQMKYYAIVNWDGEASINQQKQHTYLLEPAKGGEDSAFSFSCEFTKSTPKEKSIPDFQQTKNNSVQQWETFWTSGGFIDLTESTDPRAKELERRIILSQYLTKINGGSIFPPQETGLVYNSWYGKFHLEMTLAHSAHFALWGRPQLLEKKLSWYQKIIGNARKRAERQGFDGVRWPKMTGPLGKVSPSSVGPFLIWQEPHVIYFSELSYRAHPNKTTLEKYKELVFQTADFMASYAHLNKKTGKYVLGPDLIPAQESLPRETTINPTFELVYWYWGLSTAQKWRERLGLDRKPQWDSVINNLSPLPVKNGIYLAAESAPDSYTNPKYVEDHPNVLNALSFLPKTKMLDSATMLRTYNKVLKVWDWPTTWGWDYPNMAMTATRLGKPEKAMDALMMKMPKNRYLADGHNYQGSRLTIYLPGNGSLLMAVAMMCTGWDGYKGPPNPGFPKNGKWTVHWEGLKKIP